MKKEELNKHIASWDSEKWKEEVKGKTSLDIYRRWKQKVKEEDVYDNTTVSARTNMLPLNTRKRFIKESTKCDLCQGENEDLRHFLLECTGLSDIRKRNLALQQPYNEDEDEVIMMFLFEEDRRKMEERKTDLYSMWKLRKRKQRELNTTQNAPLPK